MVPYFGNRLAVATQVNLKKIVISKHKVFLDLPQNLDQSVTLAYRFSS